MEILDNFLIDFLKDIPKTDLINLFGLVRRKKLKKNEIFIDEGTFYNKFFYVKKGLIRGFYTDSDGEEKTIFFRWEKEFGADPESFFNHKPSKLTWSAMEETEILEMNFEKFEELSKRNVGLLKLRILTNNKLMNRMYERLESFILYSPEERFQHLLETHHDLCERIPDKYLASFLGITPVSLSRIKKRLEN
jgi:CRP-like cAMP-binding protein